MHFVVIFFAIIWAIGGALKDRADAYASHAINQRIIQEVAKEYEIPLHLAQKYWPQVLPQSITTGQEYNYAMEIAEELGCNKLIYQMDQGVNMLPKVPFRLQPIKMSREKYNARGPIYNYDIDSQVYPRLKEKLNSQGILTWYQAENLLHEVWIRYRERVNKRH